MTRARRSRAVKYHILADTLGLLLNIAVIRPMLRRLARK